MFEKVATLGGILAQKNEHPLANPRELRRIVSELPKDNAFKAQDEITGWLEALAGIDDFSLENTERIVHGWIEQKGYSLGQVMNTLRLALVGAGKGPGMYDVTSFIGKEETLRRIDNLLRNLKPGE